MRISTKGRYAVRALLDLAMNYERAPVPLKDVAARQNISPYYLEQLFVKMRRNEIVRSVRGPKGGYVLSRKPTEITVGDVIRAVEGPIVVTKCVDAAVDCPREEICPTKGLWESISAQVSDYLDSINFGHLMKTAQGIRDQNGNVACK